VCRLVCQETPPACRDPPQRFPADRDYDALAQQVLAQVMPGPRDVRAIVQIQLRSCSPIRFGRPPLGFGSSASNPRSLNAWNHIAHVVFADLQR